VAERVPPDLADPNSTSCSSKMAPSPLNAPGCGWFLGRLVE